VCSTSVSCCILTHEMTAPGLKMCPVGALPRATLQPLGACNYTRACAHRPAIYDGQQITPARYMLTARNDSVPAVAAWLATSGDCSSPCNGSLPATWGGTGLNSLPPNGLLGLSSCEACLIWVNSTQARELAPLPPPPAPPPPPPPGSVPDYYNYLGGW
jgi:hypothetical protein